MTHRGGNQTGCWCGKTPPAMSESTQWGKPDRVLVQIDFVSDVQLHTGGGTDREMVWFDIANNVQLLMLTPLCNWTLGSLSDRLTV